MSRMMTISPAEIKKVTITDPFWSNIIETVRNKVIPYQWEALNDRVEGAEPSHCMNNFKVAGKITKNAAKGIYDRDPVDIFQGFVFQDSDFSKWIEAVGYTLMVREDKELEATADEAIDIVCAAQQEDGYLDTYYIINGLDKRFTNLRDNHELYCLGHMIEGAIAYYQATGKDKLLNAVRRFADLVDRTFGPEEGKVKGYPGHELIEMALVRLYEVTHEERYLKLAKFFVDERGKEPHYFLEEEKENNLAPNFFRHSYLKHRYSQSDRPVREQLVAEGHAVRAVYLYSGMVDVARETDDKELMEVCEELWNNISTKQMYITGAIGSSSFGEAFTYDYNLPNDTVYGETCASIGLLFFANRMLSINPDSRYSDVMEKVLYNGIISGMSLDGTKFFYVNPLEVIPEASIKDEWHRHVKVERQKWFGCACCPPNLARTISSLGQYAYGTSHDSLLVHLYMSGNYEAVIKDSKVRLDVNTEYPWKNRVTLKVSLDEDLNKEFSIALRIPGWCKNSRITVNGSEYSPVIKKGYGYIKRKWTSQDTITLDMDMSTLVVSANPKVRDNIGKIAIMRGPLVYCLEEVDNGKDLHRIYLDPKAKFIEEYEADLLGGIIKLSSTGYKLQDSSWNNDNLYESSVSPSFEKKELSWIPYYSWANRKPGEMIVWVHSLLTR